MNKSQSIKNIGKAIGLFQIKCDKIKKDSVNPFFSSKYASLNTILEAIQIPLQESGLAVSQFPDGDSLTTILMHPESGEFMEASYNIHPAKVDPQGIGSAITYARRYALGAILGLNIDEDDDGNAATFGKKVPEPAKKSMAIPTMTEAQFKKVMERLAKGEAEVYDSAHKAMFIPEKFEKELKAAHLFAKNFTGLEQS